MQPMRFVAFEKDGSHAEVTAEFDVGEGIAYDEAGGRFDRRELGFCLFEEAGQRFAAVALAPVMRAEVKAVDVSAGDRQLSLELAVYGVHVRRGVEAEGDAALIGDDEDPESGLIETGDGLRHAGQEFELLPAGDVLAFGHFVVDDAVAIEKDGTESVARLGGFGVVFGCGLGRNFWLDRHPAMIAIRP